MEVVIEPNSGELTITLDQFAVDDSLTEGLEFVSFNVTTNMPRIIFEFFETFTILDDDSKHYSMHAAYVYTHIMMLEIIVVCNIIIILSLPS